MFVEGNDVFALHSQTLQLLCVMHDSHDFGINLMFSCINLAISHIYFLSHYFSLKPVDRLDGVLICASGSAYVPIGAY